MSNLTRTQAVTILRRLGWRSRTTSEYLRDVKNFQGGWNFGTALSVDGSVGPKTSAALLYSEKRRRAGLGTASAHFSFKEVRCRCGGKYDSCWRIWQKRSAFQMMERYRAHTGRSLTVVSGCRCPSHNKAVGGSPTSRHPQGLACDVPAVYSATTVKGWRAATHIGYGRSSRRVVHIDYGSGYSTTNPLIYVD